MTRDESLVEVVGAGPSGLSAAIALARIGATVHVREKRSGPGLRHHGFQGLENWSHREDAPTILASMGIETDFLLRPVRQVTYFGPAFQPQIVTSDTPLFYLVRRGEGMDSLDHLLAQQATQLGVRISYNDPVLTAPAGSIVGIGPTASMAIAKGIEFKTDAPDMALCIFDAEVAPIGYAYLLTHEHRATLAVVLTTDYSNADSYLNKAIERFRKAASFSIVDPVEFGGVGAADFSAPLMRHGHYRVGECAGLQDTLWGFGLWFAMKSGVLAAQCRQKHDDYTVKVRRQLHPLMRRLLASRWTMERIKPERYDDFIASFSTQGDARSKVRRLYGGSPWLSMLYPLAIRKFTTRLNERSCHMEDCDCVWCRHGKKDVLVPGPGGPTE